MNRWTTATARLWHDEPALPIGLYVLLAAAQLAYVHLAGQGIASLGGAAATGRPFHIGLLVSDVAGLTLLFMPAVFDRVAHRAEPDVLAVARRSARDRERALSNRYYAN